MKRVAIGLSFALAATPAMANEIAGTRVSGDGAVCAESEGKGVTINATTKEITSYCFVLDRPAAVPQLIPTLTPPPEPAPMLTPAPQPIAEPVSEPAPESTPTTDTSTVTIQPPVAWQAPEKSNVVIVNASTNEAIVREENVDEYMVRVLWSWNYWWQELMKWFESLNEK